MIWFKNLENYASYNKKVIFCLIFFWGSVICNPNCYFSVKRVLCEYEMCVCDMNPPLRWCAMICHLRKCLFNIYNFYLNHILQRRVDRKSHTFFMFLPSLKTRFFFGVSSVITEISVEDNLTKYWHL